MPLRSGSGACLVFGLNGGANIQETALSGDCPEGHRGCHWRTPVSSDPPGREFEGSIPDVLLPDSLQLPGLLLVTPSWELEGCEPM